MERVTFRKILLSAVILFGSFDLRGQSVQSVELRSHTSAASVGLRGNGVALTAAGKNQFYVQMFSGGAAATTIRCVSFDGNEVKLYDVARIVRPEFVAGRTPYLESFLARPNGGVVALTLWLREHEPDLHTLVQFDEDGSVRKVTPISLPDRQILHFAEFSRGGYLLLAGSQADAGIVSVDLISIGEDGAERFRIPLRAMTEKERIKALAKAPAVPAQAEIDPSKSSSSKPSERAKTLPDEEMNWLLVRSVLISGDDGFVYLLRPDRRGTIQRIAITGEVKEILLGGAKSSQAEQFAMEGTVQANRLLLFSAVLEPVNGSAVMSKMKSFQIATYDAGNGQQTGVYTGDARLASLFIGADERAFYFLRAPGVGESGKWEIVRATP